MSKQFVPLHLHTEYSLLDGATTLPKLIEYAKKIELKSLAITDHGNVFGAVKFFQLCKKAGIKPVLGMEAYLTDDITVRQQDNRYYHLIILVQNRVGYKNLCKLISYAYTDGFYFKPRIDYKILEKHKEGLIVTSACLGGHIPKLLMEGNSGAVQDRIDWFLSNFGRDRFFLEIQPEDQVEQKVLNQKLYELSAQHQIKLVATTDSHYLTPEDREAHEVMLAIQTQDIVANPKRYTFGECRVHVRSTQQMLDTFSGHEEAVFQSGEIAEMCDFSFETGKLYFPQSPIPQEHTPESHFRVLCIQGLERLIQKGFIEEAATTLYKERLELEMNLIIKMGFIGYFLVVSDFIQWAHAQGIPVGPGRGSAAGSVVSWALQITNIDPIKYNLLFERFLNPERVSMPDIDIDFCIEGRERVIQYVRDRYGHNKVCHIITFGTMLAKGVIKDVARALGLPFEDSNAITALIPDQLKITLEEALEAEPRLRNLVESNPKVKKIFEIALRLEGVTRHASKHAAGIVISPDPIDEVLPVYVPAKSNELITQYAMTELETLGFLKIDFLGLKNLTLIARAVEAIKQNHGVEIDVNKLPLDDQKTFLLLSKGLTSGVFQLESSGLKEVLRKLQPDKFEDIIAVNALYRPGPLGSGMVDDFIERRHGRQQIMYLFPELAPILEETYGVIVYQEQVMKIASTIAGYSLGEADILRRAMGKKKAEEMAKQEALFVSRAKERGFDEKKAKELFDLMAYFAGYGFNKSHSAAYALIAYQTAYLKCHYPAEFFACLISLEATNPEQMVFYIDDAKEMGVALLPPDINRSQVNFTVSEGKILFGLRGIKNVGQAALESIIKERSTRGIFKDLLDFCVRVDLRTVNTRVVEHLIFAGACATLPGNRAQQHAELATILELAAAEKKRLLTGQLTLFHTQADASAPQKELYTYKPIQEWQTADLLAREYEVLGFYMSAHPLSSYQDTIALLGAKSIRDVPGIATAQNSNGTVPHRVTVCGILKEKKEVITKKGDRMAFVTLEDLSGQLSVILFPKLFATVEQYLSSHTVFGSRGVPDAQTGECKLKADSFLPLDLVFTQENQIKEVQLKLTATLSEDGLKEIKNKLQPGTIPLSILFQDGEKFLSLTATEKIVCNREILTVIAKEHQISVRCIL